MKNSFAVLLGLVMIFVFVACGSDGASFYEETSTEFSTVSAEIFGASEKSTAGSKISGQINVVSREEGSGTRDAFGEITGVIADDVDNTKKGADIQKANHNIMTLISRDPQAIAYIPFGSLNKTVKAVKIEGVEANEKTIVSGEYKVVRSFHVVYKADKISEITQDFINFIMSKVGQQTVAANGLVSARTDAVAYEKEADLEGIIRVQGSTSMDPVMQALEKAYKRRQSKVVFEHTANISGDGIESVIENKADIGMVSREVKEEELEKGLTGEVIAREGIAVVVSNENPIVGLTLEQVRQIFTGEVKNWKDL